MITLLLELVLLASPTPEPQLYFELKEDNHPIIAEIDSKDRLIYLHPKNCFLYRDSFAPESTILCQVIRRYESLGCHVEINKPNKE